MGCSNSQGLLRRGINKILRALLGSILNAKCEINPNVITQLKFEKNIFFQNVDITTFYKNLI